MSERGTMIACFLLCGLMELAVLGIDAHAVGPNRSASRFVSTSCSPAVPLAELAQKREVARKQLQGVILLVQSGSGLKRWED
jgi:hypothetical protein